MQNGANFVHKKIRTELEDYVKSQYFGKTPVLFSALNKRIDEEGLFYQKPFIESSPAYVTIQNGFEIADIEPWMKEYFLQLIQAGLGVFPSPFKHQIDALEAATKGKNLFRVRAFMIYFMAQEKRFRHGIESYGWHRF